MVTSDRFHDIAITLSISISPFGLHCSNISFGWGRGFSKWVMRPGLNAYYLTLGREKQGMLIFEIVRMLRCSAGASTYR